MASPPSSSLTASAPPPPSPSTITDGAVSGTIPSTEAFAVHYPGYPSSPARAAQTLGGLSAIAKVRGSDPPGARLELRFRPEDPYCHPALGEPRVSTGLVLRLSRPKGGGDAPPRAQVVARVRNAYHFEGMSDFQHVVPVHAAAMRKRKHSECPTNNEDLRTDNEDVMMLVPPLFSIKDKPTKIALLPSSSALSKSMQRAVVQHRWEMDIGPTLALPFNINWEDHILKNSAEWGWQMAVCKMFDERPVWPRQSLYERLIDDGLQISQSQFKRLLFRAGYYFSTGPFGKFWIRRGYDPRKDPESRMFQRIDFRMPPELRNLPRKERRPEKWAEMCKLEVMPSKSFIFLQLFELKDDFIQAEIRKPSHQSTCSPMIKTLRLQLSIRLFSLCPNEDAKNFLRNAHELIERSKKQEALCRSEQLKENKEASDRHNGTEDQAGGNSDSEDVDDDEEDKDSDGYESPPMADDVPDFTLDDPYTSAEGFSNGYLEEMLRSFPLDEDGRNKLGDTPNTAEASDGEFEIYEQPSDDEESSDG
uniref:Transcription factor IIIC subunit 5 HTH domain-containing protein n=1 Tax=Leersia perrieri TaxID=77586 RepID=A0A0D9V1P1_9ORYZ